MKVAKSEAPVITGVWCKRETLRVGERSYPGTEFCVDIVVKGRKTEVPERFRKHVAEKLKLEKIQKLDGKVISLDVEVSKEHNPRQADRSDRVEITLRSRGPVIRAEAAAGRSVRSAGPGRRQAGGPAAQAARQAPHPPRQRPDFGHRGGRHRARRGDAQRATARSPPGEGRRTPFRPPGWDRSKSRAKAPSWSARRPTPQSPMTLDQALYEMELVGHDFYLFVDSETKQPSVVYRRHALRLRRHPPAARTRVAGGAARRRRRCARRLRPPGRRRTCPWRAHVRPRGIGAGMRRAVPARRPGMKSWLARPTGMGGNDGWRRTARARRVQTARATAFRGRNDGGQLRADVRRRRRRRAAWGRTAGESAQGADPGARGGRPRPLPARAGDRPRRRRRTSRSSVRPGTAPRPWTRRPTCCRTSC